MDIGNIFFGAGRKFNSLTDVASLVSFLLNTAFVVAGIIILFFFILGGIGIISSAGGAGDPQKAEQAKKTITSALIGFIVVFTAYWIVKLIGTILFGIPNIII